MTKGVSITGVTELIDILENVGERHARNLMRATIHGVAGEVAKDARKGAPKDSGTLRKAIKTKRKKSPPTAPVSDVIVTHGKNVKNDAFYWRFLEYGTIDLPEHPFIRPASERMRKNFKKIVTEEFGKKLEKALAREAKRNKAK